MSLRLAKSKSGTIELDQSSHLEQRNSQVKRSISVLMPAHNAEKTIGLAVKSTLFALPRHAVLLVGLDGCTDNTSSVLEKINDPRLKVFELVENVGVSSMLNTLLSETSTELVARMDADDVCLPWRFRGQLKYYEKHKPDFLFTNGILFGSPVKPFGLQPQVPLPLLPEDSPQLLLYSNPFMHPTMVADRAAMVNLGGYRQSAAEDYDLWIRAADRGLKIARIAQYGILYRVHANQLTQQQHWKEKLANDSILSGSQSELAKTLVSKGRIGLDAKTLRNYWSNNQGPKFYVLFHRLAAIARHYWERIVAK